MLRVCVNLYVLEGGVIWRAVSLLPCADTMCCNVGSRQRKKSTASLTPRVASPVRLFNDSAKTPLLELSIPEEKFQKNKNGEQHASLMNTKLEETLSEGNKNSSSDIVSDDYIENSAVHSDNGKPHTGDSRSGPDAVENMDSDAVHSTLPAVQSKGDAMAETGTFDSMNERESQPENIDKEEEEQDNEQVREHKKAVLRASSDEQSKLLLETAVKTAKAEAEVEAARIIAQAKAEIETAKEAAKKQLEVDDAIRKATREVELETEEKLKLLQKEAEEETEKIKKDNKERENLHTGDLYWDENDNIAGGNDIIVTSEEKQNALDIPPDLNMSEKDVTTDPKAKEDLSTPPSPTSKSRPSKIPILKKSSSSSSAASSSPLTPPTETKIEGVMKSGTETKAQIEKRKKNESRSRIRQARKTFEKQQIENEAKGTLMEFISLDELTGGDEQLPPDDEGNEKQSPPTGGDELLPDVNDDNDDDSVASTTLDEEECLPRKSASFPGQGNRPDTIRALRDIAQQREHMDKALAELQR